jgi:hypothetical protein
MLGVDQIEDYQDELVRIEDDLHFETNEKIIKALKERRDEIATILNNDKEDRKFYFNY